MDLLLIFNIVFFVFIALGFLGGLKGAKKSGLRLALVLVGSVLAACLAPVISKSLMQIEITVDGELAPISDIIINAITSVEEIGDLVSSSDAVRQLVQNFPLMIGNLVVFVVLTYVLNFITWIIYLVLASIFLKPKTVVDEKGKKHKQKEKKYRLFGGLIGAVQGLVVVFVTFLPINGFVGIISDVYYQPTEVVAEQTEQNDERTATQKLIDEMLPPEVMDIIHDYDNCLIAKVSGVFGLDDACFNAISSINVSGNKIALRDELIMITKVYDNVSYLSEIDFSSIEALKQINYTKLKNTINLLFDSNILKTVLPDVSNYIFDMFIESEDDVEFKELLTALKSDVAGDNVSNLKAEVLNVIDGLEVVVTSGLIDEFTAESVNLNTICDKLVKNDYDLINKLSNVVANSKIVNRLSLYGINSLVELTETELNNITSEPVTFAKVDVSSDQKITGEELSTLIKNIVDIVNVFEDVSIEDIENDYTLAFNKDYVSVITKIGETIDYVRNIGVLKAINFYDTCMDALQKTEHSKYVNFVELKENSVWTRETAVLSKIYNEIIDSKVVSYLQEEDIDVSEIINALATTKTENEKTQTYLNLILEPLFDSKAFKNLALYGAEMLDEYLVEVAKMISDTAYLGELHTDNLFTESEKANVISALDNIVTYLNALDFDELENDAFMTVLNSDLIKLATVLDSLKATELFGDIEGSKGVYTNLIESLKTTQFKEYIGFDEILTDGFSWNEEISNTEPMIKALLAKKIVLEDSSEIELIKYIVDGGEWDVIFDQITTEDLDNIFTPLLTSKIFKPTAVMVINEINAQIKEVVGDLGIDIVDITDIDADEVTEIIEVIDQAKDLIEEFTREDFDVSDLATGENKEKLASLLDTMQTNANGDGVFTEAYDSFVEFIQTDETIGSQVTEELAKYEDGQIDWAELINKLVK